MLKAIRLEEEKEKLRTRKLNNAKFDYERKTLKQQFGIERAKAKEKLDKIQK